MKPNNILISFDGKAKLSDMGLSKQLNDEQVSFETQMHGCMSWQPPEVLNGEKRTNSMDVFSLGCVFYYILSCGDHPFGRESQQMMLTAILSGSYKLTALASFPEAYELVERMIMADYNQRPSMKEVLLHCMFWDHEKKLRLVMDMSDHLEFLNP